MASGTGGRRDVRAAFTQCFPSTTMTHLLIARLHPLARRVAFWLTASSLLATLAACGDSGGAPPTVPERIPVAEVRITPVETPLVVGADLPLQASAHSATGALLQDRVVTWTSELPDIATVSATGVLTARAEGRAGIRASSEGKTSRIEVHIVAPHPVPVLNALSPSMIVAGSEGPLVVDVTGADFTDATRLRIDGADQTTERIDATTLRLRLSTAAMAKAGVWSVTAYTPTPGGGTSNALVLTIEDVPPPAITALDPRQITAGWGGAFTLTISGTGFTPRSTVSWDGIPRAARFVNVTTLQITIDPQDVRVARVVPIEVDTPPPGGGRAATTFTVHAIPVARVTVESPWGFAWTWRNHALRLTAIAEDQLGRELTDRLALWRVANPLVATVVPVSDREVSVYGTTAGHTDVEAAVEGVRAQRTVRVHDAPNYEIVYEAGEGDNRHLMLWDLTTAAAPRRWATPMVAFSPSPSPDGREVAFAGVEKGVGPNANVDLIIAARDGSTRRVVPTRAFEGDPAWSPDGKTLAFTSSRANGLLNVFVVELATGTVTQLTDADLTGATPGSGAGARAPAWSPDGSQLAYTVQMTTGSQLWVMAADGSNKRALTQSQNAEDFDPTWSPDGSLIAFTRTFRQPQRSLVMTVTPDGAQVGNIGGRVVSVAATPAFSPDGLWLTTAQTRGSGAGAIYAFSVAANAGPRIVMPEMLGGGRHARWLRRP